MLTTLSIRNFKRFDSVEIELGNPVVFIGPNNSGKTTALQAVALWDLGLKRWHEKRGDSETPGKRPGVAINRRDLLAVPIPDANLLWRDLHVRDVQRGNGKQSTQNIRLEIRVQGVTGDRQWDCGLEFDYANEESFYCRPLRIANGKDPERMPVPLETKGIRVAYLPPMSGLAEREFAKQAGEIAYLIGQGRTAEVLRNLCYILRSRAGTGEQDWSRLQSQMNGMFGIELLEPELIPDRAEIVLSYKDRRGVKLDLSSSGRGVQQTLLLLAYMAVNPGSVLLLDEPDAHLEILRQRQIYRALSDAARERETQVVIASHSEVVLNEAAERDVVIAFAGSPHRINDNKGTQALKSLGTIGWEHYSQAEQTGWVLYLEGSTDLAILQKFAQSLNHPAAEVLARPFVHYIENQPQKARDHFFGLKDAKRDLVGFLLCDRLDRELQSNAALVERMWKRKEIENYLCQPATLLRYAREFLTKPSGEAAMQESIHKLVPPIALTDPNLMRKGNYHDLAALVAPEDIDPEVVEILDEIHATSQRAVPRV